MAERYYWERDSSGTRDAVLAVIVGDEAQHMARVMRQKVGDEVTLFDGVGREYAAVIREIRKDRVSLDVVKSWETDVEPTQRVTIAVSLPKGDRQKWLVEKLTELGCFRLIPLKTERGVAQCSDQVLERLRRQVLEASKQCSRSTLMQVLPEMSIAECKILFDQERHFDSTVKNVTHQNDVHVEPSETSKCFPTGYIAHPISDMSLGQTSISDLMCQVISKNISVLIGPEGGFSPAEVQTAIDLGFLPIDLGKRVLRIETAAMYCTALLTR